LTARRLYCASLIRRLSVDPDQRPEAAPVEAIERNSLETDMDLLYIGLIAAFIAVSIALVYGFDKLKERP